MNSGRLIGYSPDAIVSAFGATQPSPPSTSSEVTVSEFSSAKAKPTHPREPSEPPMFSMITLSSAEAV